MRYSENRPSIREIADELNVESVIEGSVRYANDEVLVSVQLIDAATDVQIWSESYPGNLSDVFGIQADIAMNVANALEAVFSDEEQQQIEQRPTESIEAYDHWLVAQSILQQQNANVATGVRRELFQALAIDPEFADAQVLLAALLTESANIQTAERPQLEQARDDAVARALELAPDHPGTLPLIAARQIAVRQWSDAEQTLLEQLARAGARCESRSSASAAISGILA